MPKALPSLPTPRCSYILPARLNLTPKPRDVGFMGDDNDKEPAEPNTVIIDRSYVCVCPSLLY